MDVSRSGRIAWPVPASELRSAARFPRARSAFAAVAFRVCIMSVYSWLSTSVVAALGRGRASIAAGGGREPLAWRGDTGDGGGGEAPAWRGDGGNGDGDEAPASPGDGGVGDGNDVPAS